MNYSQKRTLVGRIVYIGLTLMAVTVLCITMYTFFGGARQANKVKLPITTNENKVPPATKPPISDNTPPVTEPPSGSDSKPTIVPEKDWMKETVAMPLNEGTVVKQHDLLNAVYSQTMNDYRVHSGIDIECNLGDNVLACADGIIVSVGVDPFMGMTVTIDHGDGLISVYKNLATELPDDIEVGATVLEGEVIGAVGESAIIEIADEPHLHFELTLKNEPIDPMKILDYTEKPVPEE